jgi:hypothetical protein
MNHAAGVRAAKRHDSLNIRKLRELECTPQQVRAGIAPARM